MGRARLVNVPLRASTTRHVYATIVSGGISRVARRGFAAPAEKRPKRQPHPAPGSRLAELMSDHELYGKNTKPRYPIVLCHGLFGFDVRGPFWGMEFHYWSTTLEVLRKHAKADVYVFAVQPTGSIAERAESLHNFLCDPKNGLKGQKINFIGHSMGGLDVRHLITTIRPDPSDYIPVSLTTLATPHRGSPVMDWFSANIGVGVELRDDLLRKAGHVSSLDWAQQPLSLKSPILKRRRNTDAGSNMNSIQGSSMLRMFESISNAFSSYMLSTFDQPAYAMLSTTYMNTLFNPTTPDSSDVKYFSVAARAHNMAFWHPLWLPKLVMDKATEGYTPAGVLDGSVSAPECEKGNDGLVSVASARWGTFLGIMEGWDHWDMRGPGGSNRVRPIVKETAPKEHESDTRKPTDDVNGSIIPEPISDALQAPLANGWLAINRTLAGLGVADDPDQRLDDSSWDWLEAMHAENDESSGNNMSPSLFYGGPVFPSAANGRYEDEKGVTEVSQKMAEWIASHLPQNTQKAVPTKQTTLQRLLNWDKNTDSRRLKIPSLWPSKWHRIGKKSKESRSDVGPMHELSRPPRNAEIYPRFWLALCRNLHDHGL